MAIIGVEGYGVVSIPRVEHCFSGVVWDGASLVEWGLSVVCFSGRVGIEGLQVNGAAKGTVFLRTGHHPVTPGDWFPNGDWF